MFSGIITDIGTVRSVTKADAGEGAGKAMGMRLEIAVGNEKALSLDDLAIGASVACSGACMTVVEKGKDGFAVDVSAESLSKTTLGDWQAGTAVNLERALKMGDELGGHLVSGHVDGIGHVVSLEPAGDSLSLALGVTTELAPFIAPKGSITLDGVSLTVNQVQDGPDGAVFGINIIPHTRTTTTLGKLVPGAKVNVEIDMLARYVARLQENKD